VNQHPGPGMIRDAHHLSPLSHRCRWCSLLIGITVMLLAPPTTIAATTPRNVLFLQQAGPEKQAVAHFLTGYRDALAKEWPSPVGLLTEDISAMLGTHEKLDDWLRTKYRGRRIDVIASIEGPGSQLGIEVRNALGLGAPLVLTGIGAQRYREFTAHPNVTGVTIDQDVTALLEAARRLCPQSRHLFFVPGGLKPTEAARQLWSGEAERFAADAGMAFVDLSEPLGFSALLDRVRAMPSQSILLRRDTIIGGLQRPADRAVTMNRLSAAANAPMFTLADAYAVDGSVGTGSVDYAQLGWEMGAQVAAVLAAGSAAPVPAIKSSAFTLSFDARQLERWGLNPKSLPPGSDLRFRQPGLWEAHRGKMIALTATLAAQASLIAALLLQRRRRRRAEEALRDQRAQLSHTLRLATMNQLASSLAHELNQPLTAIVNNASAARRMLARGTADDVNLHEILTDITEDGHRAGEVIRGIRGQAGRGDESHVPINLNDLVSSVRRLMAAEAAARQCDVVVELAPDLPEVKGNPVQIQQVLINLIMNGLESHDAAGAKTRRIVLRTEQENDRTVRASVRDFGQGLPPEGAEPLFKPFHTTKSQGLGMGLAIVRTIIEAHGGAIEAAPMPDAGACFQFRLPAISRVPA
jgi:signal transduction histidine kinase